MSAGAVIVWGSVAVYGLAIVVFAGYLVWVLFTSVPSRASDDVTVEHFADPEADRDYRLYLAPCVCGAPRTEDHNGFMWRKHHGHTISDVDRRPSRPTDGLEKARW